MFFWFIGTAIVAVGYVFRDPRFDYRLLIVGSLLPLLDGITGGAWVLHSLTVPVCLLGLVMVVTKRRSAARRLWLGLPIGMLMALVFDGAWTDTDVFWWPFTGPTIRDAPELPVIERGWWSILLEVVGIALCVWVWRRNELGNPDRRHRFAQTGTLRIVD